MAVVAELVRPSGLPAYSDMVEAICEIGLRKDSRADDLYGSYASCQNDDEVGFWQNPEEIAWLVDKLLRAGVESYCEIGVDRGVTFRFVRDVLQASGACSRCLALDIVKRWPDWMIPEGQAFLGTSHRLFEANDKDWSRMRFDAVFIDGDHNADWVLIDWFHLGRLAKICAFHDVSRNGPCRIDRGGGPAVVWEIFRHQYDAEERLNGGIGGIGLVRNHATPDLSWDLRSGLA